MKPTFFIFGFGYTAKFLATKLIDLGFDVIGTSRNHQELSIEDSQQYTIIDYSRSEIIKALNLASHILISIPPEQGVGDVVLADYIDSIVQYSANIKWLGYLSSTGVYGNHYGKWVDESSLCAPRSTSSTLRREAEISWIEFSKKQNIPLHVFRIAGIYGPGRCALDRLNAGKTFSIYKENQVFSRVHVEDIASIIVASITHPNPMSIYNVADDEPAPSHVIDLYAASLLNIPPPKLIAFDKAVLSPMTKDFYLSNRRVSNFKVKRELKITLQYPSFREGLDKILVDNYGSLTRDD